MAKETAVAVPDGLRQEAAVPAPHLAGERQKRRQAMVR